MPKLQKEETQNTRVEVRTRQNDSFQNKKTSIPRFNPPKPGTNNPPSLPIQEP